MRRLMMLLILALVTVDNMQSGIGVLIEDPILKVVISFVSMLIVWGLFELLAKLNRNNN